MYTERHEVTITTDASGDGVDYTPVVNGRVLSVQYAKPGSGGYDATVDFTIIGEKTNMPIFNASDVSASAVWHPRSQVHDGVLGVPLTYDGTRKVCEPVAIANERVKIVIAQGGNAKSGTFHITIG